MVKPETASRTSRLVLASIVGACLVQAPALLPARPEPPDSSPTTECTDTDRTRTIEGVRALYMEAFNAGRIDEIVELHSDSVVSMPAGMPAIEGREGLRRLVERSFRAAPDGFRYEFVAEELRRADGWAVERGVTRAHVDDEGVDIPGGKYVLLYELNDDGCWRIAWSITNTDRPPE